MSYVELGRLEEILDSVAFASARRPALVRYCRQDYFGDTARSLDTEVRDLVEQRSGRRPQGPVRMLTHLRTWGVSFNPVSFFYCFDPTGRHLEHVVAEINNTPWDERYTYVLSDPVEEVNPQPREDGKKARPKRILSYVVPKYFHVSPFIDMNVQYLWKFSQPAESLVVHMEDYPLDDPSRRSSTKIFDATLSMGQRLPFDTRNLLVSQARHPAMPVMVLLWIYRQALSLWLKKVPFYSHPKKRDSDPNDGRSLDIVKR